MGEPLERLITEILPHRYPFLLVDRITEFLPGKRIAAMKQFSANDEILQGHFPEAAILSAGVLFELVTQLGAILVMERPQMESKVAMVLQIPSARLYQTAQPGDVLRVEAEVLKIRENFGELRGAIYRRDELVGEGQMRFAVAEKTSLQRSIIHTASGGSLTAAESSL